MQDESAGSGGTISRANALLSMTSPLGPNVLIPIAARVEEAISRPFLVTVEIVSQSAALDRAGLLGQSVTLLMTREAGDGTPDTRYFNGLVRSFAATGLSAAGFWGYRAELVPGFWLLDRTQDCRIYENETAIDIVQGLLSDAGLAAAAVRISDTPASREYTIQYNESGLAFASRLLEDGGFFYFFEHAQDSHTLVIADANTVFTVLPRAELQLGSARDTALDGLTGWQPANTLPFGASRLTDYDPTAPAKLLDTTVSGTGSTRGRYEWPARSLDPTDLAARSRWRLEASEAQAALIEGGGNDPAFCPGGKFTLATDPYGGADNQSYVMRSVVHHARDGTWVVGGETPSYRNEFTAFPAATPWREPVTGSWPRMAGLFSATVIGPNGQEINTDQYGRIQVQICFDYRPDATTSTIWVRVVQPWAGNGHGWHHLPRIGSEVAVMFMDGNPDRPVVIGGLFNGTQMPIWTMPDQQTKTGLRTRSTPNGTSDDYSEFSIDDTAGSEMVLLHAQKDQTLEVENDRTVSIGHDETCEVKNNQTLTVDNDRSRTVKADESVTIQGNQTLTVQKKQSITVTSDRSVTVSSGNDSFAVQQGNISVEASQGNISTKADVGNIAVEASQGNVTTTADLGNVSITATAGNISVQANAGSITLQAGQSVTLQVGENSITVGASGIQINGLQVSVQGTMKASIQAPMAQVNADATLTLQGGIVMVN